MNTFASRLKFTAFALIPAVTLLVAAEMTVRVKYFFAHGHEWAYVTVPFGTGAFSLDGAEEREARKGRMSPREQVRASIPGASAAQVEQSSRGLQDEVDVQREFVWPPQIVNGQTRINWVKPCTSRLVYSTERHEKMPRTFDENCFRGDRITQKKDADEYRIVFLGGSTVEDAQSDAEMMTAQFKEALPPLYQGKRVRVVNAGKVGFESYRISTYWHDWIRKFSPDLALYYEAWNEQTGQGGWLQVEQRMLSMRSDLHLRLYNRSMLYTYLVEKFAFLRVTDNHFWKIEVGKLQLYFTHISGYARHDGAQLVFVTQAMNWPRMWKGVDTFDYQAVDALLGRLKVDKQYTYDVNEISALNQRLAVAYTIALCQKLQVPVINILDTVEAQGETGRAEMFLDIGHLTVKGDRIVGEAIAKRLPATRH
jgi:hypothetical protein